MLTSMTKLIVLKSETFTGLEYFIEDIMGKHLNYDLEEIKFEMENYKSFYNVFLDYLSDIRNNIKKIINQNRVKKIVLLINNFPLELCYEYITKKHNREFNKEYNDLLKAINDLLNSNKNVHLVFYWTDSSDSIASNSIETIFGKEIIESINSKVISFNKIYKNNMKNLIIQCKTEFNFNMTPDEMNLLNETVDGNLKKLENFMISMYNKSILLKKSNFPKVSNAKNIPNSMSMVEPFEATSQSKHTFLSSSITQFYDFPTKTNNLLQLDSCKNANKSNKACLPMVKEEPKLDLFHAIGKILYNKRLDSITNEPRAMKKNEMSQVPMPKSYFDLTDIINRIPCDYTQFNELLVENSFDKFNDIKELAQTLDTFSFTDTFNLFKFGTKEYVYENQLNSIEYYKTYLNASACMIENKSQYEKVNNTYSNKKEGITNFKTSIYKKLSYYKRWQHKLKLKDLYYEFLKRNSFISQYSVRGFNLDLKYLIFERLKAKNRNLNYKKYSAHFDKALENDNYKEVEYLIKTDKVDINLCDKNINTIAEENFEDLFDPEELLDIIYQNALDFDSEENQFYDD